MNAVELFTPFFSEGIANYILKKHKLGTPLTILEVARGSVTNMKAILSYYKSKFPNVYKTLRYYYLTDEYPSTSPHLSSIASTSSLSPSPTSSLKKSSFIRSYSLFFLPLIPSSKTKRAARSSAIPPSSSSPTL